MPQPLLDTIESPADLRGLSPADLARLAGEVRALITQTVGHCGGHLASNLGVVDLTIALHRVFDFTRDHLVLDVGHQCYAHKILTGRREAFRALRTVQGASGFPNPAESPYDLFKTGHAGASVSTALGLALADMARGCDARTVAVIGDGALGCGLALEGMNHAGDVKANLLVILNDNEMAISRTVGAMARYLTRMRATATYGSLKQEVHDVLDQLPMGDRLSRALHVFKDVVKEAVVPEHMFERLGFRCFGPVDGHDVGGLVEMLEELRGLEGPVLLHVHTKKGHGFAPAAEQPDAWHSAKPFQECNGRVVTEDEPVGACSWTRAAVDMLMELARGDERVVAITAAMPEGTGLGRFAHRWPERFFDVGICEQHAVALAGGLARGGLRPFVCIYSTFLQRAYDQIFHDAALQGLPVVMLVDRAGLVGADGPTHQGLYDIAYMRHLPGVTIAAPADAAELAAMMRLAAAASGPWAIRYPRDCAPPEPLSDQPVEVGRAAVLREGPDGAILALGSCAAAAMDAARLLNGEGLRLTVASARFAKPVDAQAVARLASAHPWVLTVEDHALPGGFGSAVLEAAEQAGADAGKIHRLAVPDAWIEHDARPAQLAAAGLDAAGIAAKARLLAGRG